MTLRRIAVGMLALAAIVPVPIALAQRGGASPPGGEPPAPAPSAVATAATAAAGDEAPSAAHSPRAGAAQPSASEGEGDEGDHSAPPVPIAKPTPIKREAAVLKDGMLRIPGGRFTMGSSDKSAPANERPARTVAGTAFWIDRVEVSVAAYRVCVERGACPRPVRSSSQCTFDLGEGALPVTCVPWTSANAYCIAVGKRLPREVEWENAARGTTPIRYPWGSGHGCGVASILSGEKSNRSCSGKRPSKVGAHAAGASPYGVLDMSGNVEEWVADWYSDSVADASPRSGASHVLRGGGWLSKPSASRTTSRNWGSVREAGPNVGFRCARDD